MKLLKPILGGIALSVAMTTSVLAAGFDVNASSTGLALQGYDPVAYFTENAPTPGDWTITATYNDATYRFASEENKALFEANPAAYAPQYGGYCAFGTAMGFKFDGDPNVWKIVEDKLYLNISKDVQTRWEGDVPGFVDKADDNWPDIADADPASLQQ